MTATPGPEAADPYARTEQIFPRLTADMVRRAMAYGQVVSLPEGRRGAAEAVLAAVGRLGG